MSVGLLQTERDRALTPQLNSARSSAANTAAEESALGALITGCVAVSLFAIVAVVAWLANGAPAQAVSRIALAAPVVFSVALAVRGAREMAVRRLKRAPNALARVCIDLLIFGACIAVVGTVAIMTDSEQFRLYGLWGLLIAASFLVPAAAMTFVVAEVVQQFPGAVRVLIVLTLVVGLLALASWGWQLSSVNEYAAADSLPVRC